MKITRTIKMLIVLAVLSTNIGCDQISKNIARQNLEYNQQVSLISDIVVLIRVENSGAFLGLGDSLPESVRILLFSIFPLMALVFATFYLLTKKNLRNASLTGIAFLIGGGVGNIYDRITYGSVTDFLHINFGLFRTGIFNMADVSIMTGALILIVDTYLKNRKVELGGENTQS